MTDTQNQKPENKGSGNGAGEQATPEPSPELQIPAATAEERVAALQAERDEIKDRMLRIAADFENWKKRSRKEQTDGETRVREQVLKDMLEVVDNLERATSAYVENGSVLRQEAKNRSSQAFSKRQRPRSRSQSIACR